MGELTHISSKERLEPELMFLTECAPQLSTTDSKVKWPLRLVFSYMQPITQCYKLRTVGAINPATMKIRMIHAPQLSITEMAITLYFQLC